MSDIQSQPTKGFIYGVGGHDVFLKSAKVSAESLRDHYPDAQITLVAPPRMVDDACRQIFNTIISDDRTPDSTRTKLWALTKTPYDVTMYLDADTMVVDDEIQQCWDQLGSNDIIFTLIRKYNSNPRGYVDSPDYKYHGGVFMYNRNCIKMMSEWWDRWSRGQTNWDYEYTTNFRHWDQFYLYYILKYTKHGLNVGTFQEDARWNFVNGYLMFELGGKPPIIRHQTLIEEDWGIL
jgi:hypothetical protein